MAHGIEVYLQHQTLDWSGKQIAPRTQQGRGNGKFLQGSSIRSKVTPGIFHLRSLGDNLIPWKRVSLGHGNIPGLSQGLWAGSVARLYPQEEG